MNQAWRWLMAGLLCLTAASSASGQNNFGYMRTASADGTQLDTANTFYPRGTVIFACYGVGNYALMFSTSTPHTGAIVFISALGPEAESCRADQLVGSSTNTMTQQVRCYNAAGNPVDSRYAALVLYPNNERGIAYALVNLNGQLITSWSPAGAITATRERSIEQYCVLRISELRIEVGYSAK